MLYDQISAAFRACHTDLFHGFLKLFRIMAIRITAAGNKFSETPDTINERFSAVRAVSADRFRFSFRQLRHVFFCFFKLRFESTVKLTDHIYPFFVAFGNLVQLVFHLRCKTDIHDLIKMSDQQIIDHTADLGRQQMPFFQTNITTAFDRGNDRSVS